MSGKPARIICILVRAIVWDGEEVVEHECMNANVITSPPGPKYLLDGM